MLIIAYYFRVERIYDDINVSVEKRSIHVDFQLTKLPLVISRVTALMGVLVRLLLPFFSFSPHLTSVLDILNKIVVYLFKLLSFLLSTKEEKICFQSYFLSLHCFGVFVVIAVIPCFLMVDLFCWCFWAVACEYIKFYMLMVETLR